MYYTYILYNTLLDKYYIGHTQSLDSRILEHNRKYKSNKFTVKQKGNWILVYKEEFPTRSNAMIREKQIKSMKSKVYLRQLIEQSR